MSFYKSQTVTKEIIMARKAKKKAATKKKSTAKKTTKKAKTMEALYVASKVKSVIKEYDLNMAGDALDGLNQQIYWLIGQAAARAEANNRKTVRSHDFLA